TLYWHGLAAVVREAGNPTSSSFTASLGVWPRQPRTATRLVRELQDRRPKPRAPSQEKMRNEPTEKVMPIESTMIDSSETPIPETAAQIRARLGLPARSIGHGSCPSPVNSARKVAQQPPENARLAAA